MILSCQDAIARTIGTPFEIQLPVSREAVNKQLTFIEAGLGGVRELRAVQQGTIHHQVTIEGVKQAYAEKKRRLNILVSQRQDIPKDFYEIFHSRYHNVHITLFKLSRGFLEQEALRHKQNVKTALSLYLSALPGDQAKEKNIRQMEEKLEEYLQQISLMFPVITSTLQSVRNMLPWLRQCVDRVIIDEAGMIPVHQPFPLLLRSRKAMIVGDPFQIQPIVSQSRKTIERYDEDFFNSTVLTLEGAQRYSPGEIKTATTYHRAAGASGKAGDIGQGIKLIEHYRCHPDIVDFCNDIVSYGLTPMTQGNKSLIGHNLVAYHVDGEMAENVNGAEVEAVKKIVINLKDHGYLPQDIGVISAYKAQADRLKAVLNEQPFGLDEDSVGTVHTFQGSERRVIILSTRVCRSRDNISWFDRDPNLINVAVSRAKELFILVGNLHLLESKGVHTQKLVEHIRQRGIILEYKAPVEVTEAYASAEKSAPVYDCDHLELWGEALAQAKKELYVVVPSIGGDAASKFIAGAKLALQRGVSIVVKYGAPSDLNNELISMEETALKNLFASYTGAKLIRISGEGTNERILVCDTAFAVVGSWNWLSHVYEPACQKQEVTRDVQICQEMSFCVRDRTLIESIKEAINFSG